jgi:hypothetical protein
MVPGAAGPTVLRIGACADLRARLRGYPVLDFIPDAGICYSVVGEDFNRDLEPVLDAYFANEANARPPHLRGKDVRHCVQRELKSIEYKVERLLLEEYRKRHGEFPPANPRAGSSRDYLKEVSVVENGPVHVLDKPCACLTSVELNGAQLLRLLW